MPRLVRSRLAKDDLKEIGHYIARESKNSEIALRFLDAIDAQCRTYAKQPLTGELCADLGVDVRRFPVGNYVVFYRPIKGGIEVLRIIHGARDVPPEWRRRWSAGK